MLKHWILAIRPKTLPASISPILLGTAIAVHDEQWSPVVFVLALLCALFLQIAVNLANDYYDAKSGVDSECRFGPVRVTQSGIIQSSAVFKGLVLSSLGALLIGVALAYFSSWILILFGVSALIAVYAYSGGPWPLASHGLGELTVFFYFGWLAVGGTYFAHTGEINFWVLGFGSIAGLISAAIMLVNNIRDISTDSVVGKNTLAVYMGDRRSRILYIVLLVVTIVAHLVVTFHYGLLSFLPLIIVAPFIRQLIQSIKTFHGKELNAVLAKTAQLELVYCVSTSLLLLLLPVFFV